MFTERIGNVVVLKQGGVFKQATVYSSTLDNRVYAKYGSGYIRLGTGDATSHPKVSRVCNLQEAPQVAIRNKFTGPEFVHG